MSSSVQTLNVDVPSNAAAIADAARQRVRREKLLRFAVPTGWLFGALLLWEAIVRINHVPDYIIPAPSVILRTLFENWDSLSLSLLFTLKLTFLSLALAVVGGVALAMLFWPGVSLHVAHPWAVIWFGLMGAVFLSCVGLLSSIWAEKFDHNAALTSFVVTPLTMLSGTFYVISNLSPAFQIASRMNRFCYGISGFR